MHTILNHCDEQTNLTNSVWPKSEMYRDSIWPVRKAGYLAETCLNSNKGDSESF